MLQDSEQVGADTVGIAMPVRVSHPATFGVCADDPSDQALLASQPSPQMLDAGVAVLRELHGEVGSAFLVREVWMAMEEVR